MLSSLLNLLVVAGSCMVRIFSGITHRGYVDKAGFKSILSQLFIY